MKHLILLLIGILSLQTLTAQEFEVREFKADPSDLSARTQQKRTVNDEPCALVKVNTNIKGMQFDSNIGIVDVVHQTDGYWLYIAPKERRIRLMAKDFLSLDVDMPEPAEALKVYNLVVAQKFGGQISDLVKVTFRMNESNVNIRSGGNAPILEPSSNAVLNLPKGEHTFTFFKEGFNDLEKRINVEKEEIIDITLVPGVATSKLALSGWIIITSEPSGAEVYLNDQRVGKTPYQAKQTPGKINLRLQYPLYYEHQEQFELGEGATVTLPIVNLKPRFGYWQATSTPTGAEVFLDGKRIGVTPLSKGQISSGNHELVLRKSMYHEYKENFKIADGDEKNFSIPLKEAFGTLAITSDPSGATVYVDGREVGKTPYENKMITSGAYDVRLTMDLFSDSREQVVVTDGNKTEKFIALSKNFGTLNITAEGADIYLNDKNVGTGSYKANLTPGQYKLKATKDRHTDDTRDVFITLGQTENITLTPKPQQGGVSIVTNPFDARGAEIYINNEKQKKTTPATIPLLIGTYNVTVKKAGYLEASQSVVIKEGAEQELNFTMQTYQGSMLQTANRYKKRKLVWGAATVVAVGTGGYFRYSVSNLTNQYKTATTDATEIYDRLEQHDLFSYVAFGAAVPCAVMTIVKAAQQGKAKKKANLTLLPTKGGAVVGLAYTF